MLRVDARCWCRPQQTRGKFVYVAASVLGTIGELADTMLVGDKRGRAVFRRLPRIACVSWNGRRFTHVPSREKPAGSRASAGRVARRGSLRQQNRENETNYERSPPTPHLEGLILLQKGEIEASVV